MPALTLDHFLRFNAAVTYPLPSFCQLCQPTHEFGQKKIWFRVTVGLLNKALFNWEQKFWFLKKMFVLFHLLSKVLPQVSKMQFLVNCRAAYTRKFIERLFSSSEQSPWLLKNCRTKFLLEYTPVPFSKTPVLVKSHLLKFWGLTEFLFI